MGKKLSGIFNFQCQIFNLKPSSEGIEVEYEVLMEIEVERFLPMLI